MKTGMMRKIAVLVTGSALALSVPVAGAIAGPGGPPPNPGSQGKANQHKHQGQQHKQNGLNGGPSCPDQVANHGNHRDRHDLKNKQAQDSGLKCGFTTEIHDLD